MRVARRRIRDNKLARACQAPGGTAQGLRRRFKGSQPQRFPPTSRKLASPDSAPSVPLNRHPAQNQTQERQGNGLLFAWVQAHRAILARGKRRITTLNDDVLLTA